MSKTIGILGGMGPEAAAYFFKLVVGHTKAETDQQHLKVLVHSDPLIPNRTEAVLGTGPSPVPNLEAGIRSLLQAGADLIVMPCITAHHFIPEVREKLDFHFIDMVEVSAAWAAETIPSLKKAGLLSSPGTLRSGLFEKAFGRRGVDIILPDPSIQDRLNEAVFGQRGIKAGYKTGPARESVVSVARMLAAQGAEAVVAGCTEIPLVLREEDIPVPLIDPMTIAALACIREAGGQIRDRSALKDIP